MIVQLCLFAAKNSKAFENSPKATHNKTSGRKGRKKNGRALPVVM
jgi:hypothetical protein